jgi:hypothetical protein
MNENIKLILANYYFKKLKNYNVKYEIKNNIIISRLPDANTKQFISTYSTSYNKINEYNKTPYIKILY